MTCRCAVYRIPNLCVRIAVQFGSLYEWVNTYALVSLLCECDLGEISVLPRKITQPCVWTAVARKMSWTTLGQGQQHLVIVKRNERDSDRK